MLDDPAAQAQHPATFDLEDGGGLIIGGGGGSGKSTALRTAALSAIIGATPDEVTLFVIDCSSRALMPLMALPHVAAVATGDDIESVTRVITLLTAELDRRRPLLTDLDVQAENLSAYLDKGHSLPRIVVLVDGFQNLPSLLGVARPSEHGPLDWAAEFQRIVTDGRQLGIHVVIAADRRQAIPPILMSAIGNRLVLRQTDDGGYIDYGISAAMSKGLDLPNGRGLCENRLVQVGRHQRGSVGGGAGRGDRPVRGRPRRRRADGAEVGAAPRHGERAAQGDGPGARSRSGARTCSGRSSRSASATAGCA